VAIDEGRDQAAVDEAGQRDVVGPGREDGHGFFAVPAAFQLQAVFVEPSAAVAMAEVVGIGVLEGGGFHWSQGHQFGAGFLATLAEENSRVVATTIIFIRVAKREDLDANPGRRTGR
jgi:hypothetical protein